MTSILLVDDDEALRSILTEGLESEGFDVTGAANGREALKHLETGTTDIVLTDLAMPEMDGIELIRHLHSEYARQFRIIAMTAGIETSKTKTSDFVLLRAADAMGAMRTIEKPFRLCALLDILQEISVS